MYPLFETIRIEDGIPMHLEWHQQRLDLSFSRYFGRSCTTKLKEVFRVSGIPEEFRSGRVKCRFRYSADMFEIHFEQYAPRQINTLRMLMVDDLDYSLKYTDRTALNKLLAERGDCDDILIIKNGMITDTSYTNIVFNLGDQWVTSMYPLLEGTCRNRLISEGKILETELRPKNLNEIRSFKLVNAMLDFESQPELPVGNIF